MHIVSRPNSTLTQSVKRENSSKILLDRILSSENTIQVVRDMPSPSLLLLIKDVGLADTMELLELMSANQIQEHLDLDVWVGDRINFKSIGEWLQTLFAANARKAVQQMHGLDFDLICFLFKSHATIFDTQEGEEPIGNLDLHTITPDRRYIVAFYEEEAHETNGIGHSLKAYLESLYERDLRFVFLLMEAVRHETASSLEESAYDFRRTRLADMGFPELEQALSVFSYQDPDSAALQTTYEANKLPPQAATNFIMQIVPQNQNINHALQSLDQERREQIEHALIYLVNQVFVVRNGGNFDLETMKKSGDFAMATLNLGLRYLSKDKPEEFGFWLSKLSPQQLFRTGFSLLIKLQRQWRALVRAQNLSQATIAALDFPLKEVVEGINRRIPSFFCNLTDHKNAAHRTFSELTEVALTARALSQSAFRASLVGPHGLAVDFEKNLDHCHGVYFATYLCNQLISPESSVKDPLQKFSDEMLEGLFNRLEKIAEMRKFTQADKMRIYETAKVLAKSLQAAWPKQSLSELESKAVSYADIVLGAVEAEFSRLSHAPSKQFITSLL